MSKIRQASVDKINAVKTYLKENPNVSLENAVAKFELGVGTWYKYQRQQEKKVRPQNKPKNSFLTFETQSTVLPKTNKIFAFYGETNAINQLIKELS